MRAARLAQCLSRKLGLDTRIPRRPNDLVDHISRVTMRKWLLHLLRDALHQIFRKSILTREYADLAFPPEHFDELFRASVGHADFILNPAQERLVRELLRVQIRREHHKDIKWHFEFSSSWQRQKINTTIERRHPAIEKLIC